MQEGNITGVICKGARLCPFEARFCSHHRPQWPWVNFSYMLPKTLADALDLTNLKHNLAFIQELHFQFLIGVGDYEPDNFYHEPELLHNQLLRKPS